MLPRTGDGSAHLPTPPPRPPGFWLRQTAEFPDPPTPFWSAWVLPVHDYLVMGHWWQMPYNAPGVAQFHIGFTQSTEGVPYVHTPLQAVRNLVAVIVRLATWHSLEPA